MTTNNDYHNAPQETHCDAAIFSGWWDMVGNPVPVHESVRSVLNGVFAVNMSTSSFSSTNTGSPALLIVYHNLQTTVQPTSNRTLIVGGLPEIVSACGCFINNMDGDRTLEAHGQVGSRH